MKRVLMALAAVGLGAGVAAAQVANVKVVTDANPDYYDLDSLVHSATSNWQADKDKMWALYYWNHIARRQTAPMQRHGYAVVDPILQFNDYGFAMCSTISGVNCAIWEHMGYKTRYFDIGLHTVPEVWYDNGWHHYDNSLSIIYTLCDGKTIAGIEDVGKTLGCAASGGKEEPGHIAIYHCLNGTSVDGFCEGADTIRDLRHVGVDCFNPSYLKNRTYYRDRERGHRYILNLRDGEVYARYYHRLDKESPNAKQVVADNADFKADAAYYVHGGIVKETEQPYDWESANPRYRIRGNGIRTWKPELSEKGTAGALHGSKNVKAAAGGGLEAAGGDGEAVFKVEGANVITSMKVDAEFAGGAAALLVSTNNGKDWKEAFKGDGKANLKLVGEVNGSYEVLVKAALPAGATLKGIAFETVTQVNAKTQPQLKLGRNVVYVGTGEQTGSIVVWPELQEDKYKAYAVDSNNVTSGKHEGWHGVLGSDEAGGHVTFRIDAPQDIVKVTQAARMYVRVPKAEVRFEHSFDDGKTWTTSYTHTETEQPWDDIQIQPIKDVPAGVKSVLLRYNLKNASLYSVRMEANHKLADATFKPIEVTFAWDEVGKDYKKTRRSHTQLVEKAPFTYAVNVGGYDHPTVDALTVNLKGATTDVTYGYSDGTDAGGEKFVGKWWTYGTNLAKGRPYTASVKSLTEWEAGDPEGKTLTDGIVGPPYNGGISYRSGALYPKGSKPEIVIDLGEARKFSAVRAQIAGYEWKNAITGEIKDKIEVASSSDGTQWTNHGEFDFNLYWKDVPVNYMWTDEESFCGHNFTKLLPSPAEARYVKFTITPERHRLGVSELQVLDWVKGEPFDLKLALPKDAPAPVAGTVK